MNVRQLTKAALDSGEFEDAGRDGQGHKVLLHIATGNKVTYPTHAQSDVNTVRNIAKAIEDLLGRPVWKRGSRKPGRGVKDPVPQALRDKWARQREEILAKRDREDAQRREARALRERRERAVAAAERHDRERHFIESLMRRA